MRANASAIKSVSAEIQTVREDGGGQTDEGASAAETASARQVKQPLTSPRDSGHSAQSTIRSSPPSSSGI